MSQSGLEEEKTCTYVGRLHMFTTSCFHPQDNKGIYAE